MNADKYEVVLIADKSASIDTVIEENDKPYVEGGILYVNGATEGDTINIYATDGLLLNSVKAVNGINAIPVNDLNGVIIVGYGTTSSKLTVK